jgi:putative transposase
LRYVERNALRAGLVRRAQDWRWCSLWRQLHGDEDSLLSNRPIDVPADWVRRVNRAQSSAELQALRRSVNRGTPDGSNGWQARMAKRLAGGFTLRPRGRPRKRVH